MKSFGKIVLAAIMGSAFTIGMVNYLKPQQTAATTINNQDVFQTARTSSAASASPLPNLSQAAEHTVHSVVHVTTTIEQHQTRSMHPLEQFFYGRPMTPQARTGTGSGVIISPDGYIVTNNHVIDKADKVEITLNNRERYLGEVVGRDPSTDLALLKVEQENLPAIDFGNSESLRLGEWVLAVGNPFNLTSTVTAGIVSAKARDINILDGDPYTGSQAVESFIQTDAAVNPGNSGGALVNQSGQLVGINAAIKSNTGSYTGYSFAIPANIVKKVVEDLKEYGSVQRAYIGVSIREIDDELKEAHDLPSKNGVYINSLLDNGSAIDAGIEAGDVIKGINGHEVNTVPELQEQLSKYRPGDKIMVSVYRDGAIKSHPITLKNRLGNTDIIEKKDNALAQALGATLEPVEGKLRKKLGIAGGVQVKQLQSGKLASAGVREGFVITKVNGKNITSYEELSSLLEGKKGGVLLEGIYPNGLTAYYGFGL